MDQLSLYHQMGCPESVLDHPLYSQWLYRREVEESVACGRAPEMNAVRFEDEHSNKQPESSNKMTEIKCRKCRLVPLQYLFPQFLQINFLCLALILIDENWRPPPSLYPMNREGPQRELGLSVRMSFCIR